MECDAVVKNTNITPLIYNHLLFKEGGQEQFLKELSDLYNRHGLDSRLNIRDFLLAEMTFNFLGVINNTIDKEFEMKVCNEPGTIKISDCTDCNPNLRYNITLGELYNKIKSYPHDTMDFCITDVFSWRGIYAEPCCSLSTEQTTKQENLDMLRRLTNEVFYGYKGGEYTYDFDDRINFECDYSEYSSGGYLKDFIKINKYSEIINHIFG